MSGVSGQVAEVTRQDGEHVIISVPMVGFPSGFKLRPGERVVLVREEGGLAARPLVRSMTVDSVSDEGADTLRAGDQRFAVQASTIREGGDAEAGRAHDVFVLDSGSAEGSEQVLAVRPAPPSR
jgi:hypothetical protein